MTGVSWRRALVAIVTVVVALIGTIVFVRGDGFPAIDATVPRATRWFFSGERQSAVLADGFSGKTLAAVKPDDERGQYAIAQSASGVALLSRTTGIARPVDAAALRLGPPTSIELLSRDDVVYGVGQTGLVVVSPSEDTGVLVPPDGESVTFEVGRLGTGDNTRISPDGAVWSLRNRGLVRITTVGPDVYESGLGRARFTLVGSTPLLFDQDAKRLRFGDGGWVDLPEVANPSELVLQQPGPQADCGWIGTGDLLWCIGPHGVMHEVEVANMALRAADRLAIGGDAGAIVRAATSEIVRLDWRKGAVLDDGTEDTASVPQGVDLAIATSVDLVWIDEVRGETVWSVDPWGINVIHKDDEDTPVIDELGEVQTSDAGAGDGDLGGSDPVNEERQPDNNGVDDPPVANPDSVSARFGLTVPIVVTANDYDPDGDPIAVVEVEKARQGKVSILNASTVLFSPQPGFVGTDQFEYTIVDANGTPDTATVTVQLLPADAPNRAPIGAEDAAETRADTPVIIDVLANDVDPERDSLDIGTFLEPDIGGTVRRTKGPTELAALQYTPPPGASGVATFEYRPVDSFGAVGEPVRVRVDIAAGNSENRPPVVQPDALRIRRNAPTPLPVLANDRDPDGDTLAVTVPREPDGIDVRIDGQTLIVTARAGAAAYTEFTYEVDDGHNPVQPGRVLVALIPDDTPNQPPVASADSATAVVGEPTMIEVLANDRDPDDDSLFVVSAEFADPSKAVGTVTLQGNELEYLATDLPTDEAVFDRLVYVISDGQYEVSGEVTVRVLPEKVSDPPWARDDSTTTTIGTPVNIEVLRNDGDPSGQRPSINNASCPAGSGTVAMTSQNGPLLYTPPDVVGIYRCEYGVVNSQGLTATAHIIVSVVDAPVVNSPPVVGTLEYNLLAGATGTFDLLAGATDPDGDPLTIVSLDEPSRGTADRVGTTSVRFTAPDRRDRIDIRFNVSDDKGGVTSGRIVINVVPLSDVTPVAGADRVTVDINGPVVIPVLDNDRDPDAKAGDELVVSDAQVTDSSGASISTNGTTVTVTPDPAFIGTISATYVITDVNGLTATGQISVTVVALPNRAPVAGDTTASVANGARAVVPLSATDPDADPLTYSISAAPAAAFGTAFITGASLVFDAVPGASGQTTIEYTVSDGEFQDAGTVIVTVLPCTVLEPIANDAELTTGYMQAKPYDLTPLAVNGEIVEVSAPLNTPVGTYTPAAGFNDTVTATYVVRNSCGLRATGTVTIDVNQVPVATAVSERLGRFDVTSVAVSDLATDPDRQGVRITELSGGAPAWVTIGGAGTRLDIAPNGAFGRVTFQARVEDVGGLFVLVDVTIDLTNQPPNAVSDTVRADDGPVTIFPLTNDTDPENDVLSLFSVPDQVTFTNGVTVALEVLGSDRIRIDPGAGIGTATFEYTAVDQPGLSSNPATITVIVNSPPRAPNVDISLAADSSITVQIPASDPDPGDTLTLTILEDPAPLVITVNGLSITVTAPPEAANTLYAIRYRVTDQRGARDGGVLNINVGDVATTTTTTPPTTAPPLLTTTTTSLPVQPR